MPVATVGQVRKQIQAGAPDPIYLIQGEDDVEKSALAGEFAALVDEALRAFNVEHVHAGELTAAPGEKLANAISSLVTSARTLPMMASRRVVVVFQAENLFAPRRDSEAAARALDELEALLENPEPQTTLVFVSAPLDRRIRTWRALQKHATIVACGDLRDLADAQQWVRTRVAAAGAEIEPAAARLVAQLAGFPPQARDKGPSGDVKRLRADVDRLLLYALGQQRITADDVRDVAGPAALQDDWAMTNAIEAGYAADALRQLALMLDAGAPPEKILGQLGWLVRSKFPAIAPDQIRPAVDALFRTDLDLKRSAGDARVLLERLVVELCAGKRSRMAGRRW